MGWHSQEFEGVFKELKTSEDGLSAGTAEERLSQYGPNVVSEDGGTSKLKIFLNQFKNPLIYVLIIAGAITLVLEEYVDSGVIFAVVLINALVGFFQEYRAEESAKALRKMLALKATVIRDGRQMETDSSLLVPGDIVVLSTGSKIPADLRLFKAVELSVDESILTGESVPVEKNTSAMADEGQVTSDQENMAFLGTYVVSGKGMGVVVETGYETVMGKIARDVREVTVATTPLQEKFHSFAKLIGVLSLISASTLFIVGVSLGEGMREMFKVMVAVTVATIPEGLPVVVTIAMAIGVSRMARRHSIIKKMPAVETLGSTTVICSDKTGTLTKNEMTVKKMWAGGRIMSVEGEGYAVDGHFTGSEGQITHHPGGDFRRLLEIGLLCNNSGITPDGIIGKPTEASILVAALKAGLNQEEYAKSNPRIHEIPFNSDRKRQVTVNETPDGPMAYSLGAPDIILGKCSKLLMDDAEVELTKELRDSVLAENAAFASSAYRVLGAAYRRMEDENIENPEENMVFAGLFAMIDPPRPDAIQAVKGCRDAGIRVLMITGDHALTAAAIARQLDIGGDDPRVLTGKELNDLSDEQLYGLVQEVSIYARVTSHQKLRIVQQLIKHGEIVAVTGDGVNDAPSLKAAHIGVAMGKTGSDVTKESADMILSDDNFASIFAAVEEGRVVYSNIKKVTFFLLPTGIAVILAVMTSMTLGLAIPYLATQLLWINLVTNGLQDVALAFEPGEKDLIKRKPRNPKEGIMSRVMVERTLLVALVLAVGVMAVYLTSLSKGFSIEKARTMAVTTHVFFQFFHVWNSRSELNSITRVPPFSNPFLFYSLIAALLAQISLLYAYPLRWIFQTVPLTLSDWILCVGVASTVIIVVEIEKKIRRTIKAQM
jgi:P-type Ca2+ transporter type 2C